MVARAPARRVQWAAAARRLPVALIALVALVALAGCEPAVSSDVALQRGYRGVVLPEPLPKPDLALLDTNGDPYDFRRETEGKLTLLFFGYTSCPDICPVHLASIAAVLDQMPELLSRTEVVFVTVDPEHDSPERVRDWLDNFSHRFVGLRGPVEEVHRAEQALDLPVSSVPDDGHQGAMVGHAAQVIAFAPDGHAHVVFPFGTRQSDYANDLPRLLDQEWPDAAAVGAARADDDHEPEPLER